MFALVLSVTMNRERVVQCGHAVLDRRCLALRVHVEELLRHIEQRYADERLSVPVGLFLLLHLRFDLVVAALIGGAIVGNVVGRPELRGRLEVLFDSVAHGHALAQYVLIEAVERRLALLALPPIAFLEDMLAGKIRSTYLL